MTPHRWRGIGAWLGILALAMQTVIPLGQGISVADASSLEQALLFHCKVMKAGTSPSEPQAPSGQGEECPVCIAGAIASNLITPTTVAVPFFRSTSTVLLPYRTTNTVKDYQLFQTTARAPPVSA